jgi:uncharacterized membrane protein YdbT with pleckstrin-like domain
MSQRPIFTLKPSHWINIGYYLVSLIGLVYFPFCILIGIYKYLEIEFWHYDFYDSEILERKGVFKVTHRKISIERIKDVALDEPFFYRLVGIGNYYISSSDPYLSSLELKAVPHTDEFWMLLRSLVNTNSKNKNKIEVDLNYL